MSISRKITEGAGSGSGGGSGGPYVDDVFSTYLYTGNTEKGRDIVNGIDLDGEGGLVWIKARGNKANGSASSHILTDTERGLNSALSTNKANGESLEYQQVTAFNNNGFTIDDASEVNMGDFNGWPAIDYASWTFRKQPKFFDVVTYTGDGVKGREIPHNLGVKPGMIIVKCSSASADWMVWHAESPASSQGEPYMGILNSTDPINNTYNRSRAQVYEVTDANFKVLGTANNPIETNLIGNEYVAYVFAHDDSDESMIKCGSFTDVENSGASSQHIELGFEPQFILMKTTSRESGWYMWDTMRGMSEPQSKFLLANDSVEESYIDSPFAVYPTPTGFYMPGFWGAGEDVIYMAIRRPNKPAEEFEPEELFDIAYGDGSGSPDFKGPLTDFRLSKDVNQTSSVFAGSRLQGTKHLKTAESEDESNASYSKYDYMDGWSDLGLASPNMSWMWRRAPGFFDVVTYAGDGQAGREVPHNLAVAPEMMWIKRRNGVADWPVYYKDAGQYQLKLNERDAPGWDYTDGVSDTTFTLKYGGNETNQAGGSYIAYLFASVPGISAIGTYTGDGSGYQVIYPDGLSGASIRFVLVKRVDGNGNWIVFDRERGTDAALALNLSDAQKTGDFWSWTFGAFGVKSNNAHGSEWNPNINGATYIYMAIA